ncbi:MAG: PHP domain-containing protein [Actinomycetes bacterium]
MCDSHSHDHSHAETPAWSEDIPTNDLEISRRGLIGALGAVAGAAALAPLGAAPAGATTRYEAHQKTTNPWKEHRQHLAGDHHIHTQYSRDAMHTVDDQVKKGTEYGLDWMVITDHGGTAHQKFSIDQITPEISAARKHYPTAIFQGLEWNVPGAEHATVILPPHSTTPGVLKQFELLFDGTVLADAKKITNANASDGEPYAVAGLKWLADQIKSGVVPMALMFANHPTRKGLDSPSEVRAWRDAAPGIAMGWEGAPGHQAAGISTKSGGPGSGRGYYDNAFDEKYSYEGYRPNATENPLRTYGGFDWATARVGGLWDSLLAEGKPWWITANSDSHQMWNETLVGGNLTSSGALDTAVYNKTGKYAAPVDSKIAQTTYGDFWPGFYTRTIVSSISKSYLTLMKAMQAGLILTTHGGIIDGADIRVTTSDDLQGVTTGGRTFVKKGGSVTATITISLASNPNYAGFLPKLKKVDLISGPITGPVTDTKTMFAPNTKVEKTFEVSETSGDVVLTYTWKNVGNSMYLRYRGSDGKVLAANGVDPAMDVIGDANPWNDLWFYTNPVFVDAI